MRSKAVARPAGSSRGVGVRAESRDGAARRHARGPEMKRARVLTRAPQSRTGHTDVLPVGPRFRRVTLRNDDHDACITSFLWKASPWIHSARRTSWATSLPWAEPQPSQGDRLPPGFSLPPAPRGERCPTHGGLVSCFPSVRLAPIAPADTRPPHDGDGRPGCPEIVGFSRGDPFFSRRGPLSRSRVPPVARIGRTPRRR